MSQFLFGPCDCCEGAVPPPPGGPGKNDGNKDDWYQHWGANSGFFRITYYFTRFSCSSGAPDKMRVEDVEVVSGGIMAGSQGMFGPVVDGYFERLFQIPLFNVGSNDPIGPFGWAGDAVALFSFGGAAGRRIFAESIVTKPWDNPTPFGAGRDASFVSVGYAGIQPDHIDVLPKRVFVSTENNPPPFEIGGPGLGIIYRGPFQGASNPFGGGDPGGPDEGGRWTLRITCGDSPPV